MRLPGFTAGHSLHRMNEHRHGSGGGLALVNDGEVLPQAWCSYDANGQVICYYGCNEWGCKTIGPGKHLMD